MKMGAARVSVGSAVLVTLLARIAVAGELYVVGGFAGGAACDGVSCGMGTCKEVPVPVPVPGNLNYECDCDAGWARIMPIMPFTPCDIPACPSDHSCYTPTLKLPPLGSNITLHPCLVMDCGPEGTCVEEQDKPFRCQCKPGATNVLNDTSLPCTKNCVIGKDGCPVKSPPPSSSPPPQSPPAPPPSSTAPPDISHGSSGPTAPASTGGNPSTTDQKASPGSICLPNLLLPLLLLASLAALYIV